MCTFRRRGDAGICFTEEAASLRHKKRIGFPSCTEPSVEATQLTIQLTLTVASITCEFTHPDACSEGA